MKLEVGMYIRYIPTMGEYTQKISKITKTKNCMLDMCYTLDDKEEVFSSHFDDILEASYNIIDLIEVGDYVNGYQVTSKDQFLGFGNHDWYMLDNEIKSIVTKEQFESMSYKVEVK